MVIGSYVNARTITHKRKQGDMDMGTRRDTEKRPRFTGATVNLSMVEDVFDLIVSAVQALKHAGATDMDLLNFSVAISVRRSDKQIAEEIKAWIDTEGEYQS